jgi:hypothetical protein
MLGSLNQFAGDIGVGPLSDLVSFTKRAYPLHANGFVLDFWKSDIPSIIYIYYSFN